MTSRREFIHTLGTAVALSTARSRAQTMRPVQHDGRTITLLQVAPYPFSTRPIQPQDYRVTLKVSR